MEWEKKILVVDDAFTYKNLKKFKSYLDWEDVKDIKEEGDLIKVRLDGKIYGENFYKPYECDLTIIPDADEAIKYIKEKDVSELEKYDRIICDLEMPLKSYENKEYATRIFNNRVNNQALDKVKKTAENLEKLAVNTVKKFIKISEIKIDEIYFGGFRVYPRDRPTERGDDLLFNIEEIENKNITLHEGGLAVALILQEKLKSKDKITIYTSGLWGHSPSTITYALVSDVIDGNDLIEVYSEMLNEKLSFAVIKEYEGYTIYTCPWEDDFRISKNKKLAIVTGSGLKCGYKVKPYFLVDLVKEIFKSDNS